MLEQIASFQNLVPAFKKALRSCRNPRQRAFLLVTQERLLLQLQRDLASGEYTPQPPRQFHVYEPKCRLITAPNFRDRVAHHAICNLIEPLFEQEMYAGSFACRVGKGTHRAIGRCQELMNQYAYVLKGDVHQFFASIDQALLRGMLEQRVSDPGVRLYLSRIIAAHHSEGRPGKGLPIGNLTSQLFANIYLNEFDWFVQSCGGGESRDCFVRYMDDWLYFADSKEELWRMAEQMQQFLAEELLLEWLPAKRSLTPSRVGLPFLGLYVKPASRRLNRDTRTRAFARLRSTGRARREHSLEPCELQQAAAIWRAVALPTLRPGFLRKGYQLLMVRP